jgi:hypothetical protein
MHFWIDKRSSYGIGHNRPGMGCQSYQPRRIRSKSVLIPQIPIRPPIPSHHIIKSNHHRNRNVDSDHHRPITASRTQQHSTTSSQVQSIPIQHVPVIHSVYPRDELSVVNHVVDSENTRSDGVINHWLPLQIICGICIMFATALVLLKLYFDNEMTGVQLLSFGSISIAFLICTTTISILRMRKNRLNLSRRNEVFTETIIEPMGQQITIQLQSCGSLEPPPPYNVAINLPEKQSSPPPSYEKIHII